MSVTLLNGIAKDEGGRAMDQPKNHSRIIAHVAAIGARKKKISRFNESR